MRDKKEYCDAFASFAVPGEGVTRRTPQRTAARAFLSMKDVG
jgi:hypothetical protein